MVTYFSQANFLSRLRSLIDMTGSSSASGGGGSSQPTQSNHERHSPPTTTTDAAFNVRPTRSRPESASRLPARKRRRQGPSLSTIEPDSLFDSIRRCPTTSLHVVPICWTPAHAAALDAVWVKHPSIDSPTPRDGQRYPNPTPAAALLGAYLQRLLKEPNAPSVALGNAYRPPTPPSDGTNAMRLLMQTLFPHTLKYAKSNVDLGLSVGSRTYPRAVRAHLVWRGSSRRSNPSSQDTAMSFDSASTVPCPEDERGSIPTSSRPTLGREPSSQVSREDSGLSATISNSQSSTHDSAFVLAFLSRSELDDVRRHLFRVVPGPDHTNEPVRRLQALRSKQLIPPNPDEDPYLIAVFLALAQTKLRNEAMRRASDALYGSEHSSPFRYSSQRARLQQQASSPPSTAGSEFRDVHVQLVTHSTRDGPDAHFVVYSAVVSAALLRRWANPTRHALPRGWRAGIRIEYVRVNMYPILGLKERLAKAMGPAVAGFEVFEDMDIDTWGMVGEMDSYRSPTSGGDEEPGEELFASSQTPAGARYGGGDALDSTIIVEDANKARRRMSGGKRKRPLTASSCDGDEHEAPRTRAVSMSESFKIKEREMVEKTRGVTVSGPDSPSKRRCLSNPRSASLGIPVW